MEQGWCQKVAKKVNQGGQQLSRFSVSSLLRIAVVVFTCEVLRDIARHLERYGNPEP
jgi:hypothetical protein